MNHTFDALQYTLGAEAAGIKREHAEYQAQQISKFINNRFITKSDLNHLERAIVDKLTIKLGSMMFGCSGIIIAILSFVLKH